MKATKHYSVMALLICSVIALLGCGTIKEGAKGFLGVSTRTLEEERKNAIIRTFNYDYATCYDNTLAALKHMRSYVYKKNRQEHMIAIYVSDYDTTPVGLFFKEIDKTNTQVEVSSSSTYAKEFISEKVFLFLDKKVTGQELEVQADVEKEKTTSFSD
jgi:hypothetical protein